jgi:tetratricopeptide (TPR) repeat protein
MHVEVSLLEKPRRRARFLPLLVLNLTLNLAVMGWPASAPAQVSSLTNADGEISGTVFLEADKRPASQVAVSLKSRAAGIVRSVLTDLEGRFKVRNLPRGTYDIAVDEQGYEVAQTSALLDGPSANLVVYLRPRSGTPSRNSYTVSVRELKIPSKAQDELRKGLESAAKSDFAAGLRHLLKATQQFPGYFEAYYNIGVIEEALGHTDQAAKAFQTAIDLSGGRYALAEFGYGYLLCQLGRPLDAEKVVRQGLQADDAAPAGYVILGEALRQLNRIEEAGQSAHEALLRNPNYPGAYLVLADVAEIKADYLAEIQYLNTYLKLLPNGPATAQVSRVREHARRLQAGLPPKD